MPKSVDTISAWEPSAGRVDIIRGRPLPKRRASVRTTPAPQESASVHRAEANTLLGKAQAHMDLVSGRKTHSHKRR